MKYIAPCFGGINLEDIASPKCFEVEARLEKELDIPVFHDDQHGTAVVVTAALLNALKVVGKKIDEIHVVLNGPGSAGTAIIKMLLATGVKTSSPVMRTESSTKTAESASRITRRCSAISQTLRISAEHWLTPRRCGRIYRRVRSRCTEARNDQNDGEGSDRICNGKPESGDHVR